MVQGIKGARIVRTGYECNNRCRFCNQGDLRATDGDQTDAELLEDVVRAARDRATIVLSGGEVTARRQLGAWIRAGKEQGAARIAIQTNGRMLAYRKLSEGLARAGLDIVALAVHGHVAELHDWLTRVPGSFAQATNGARNSTRAGMRLIFNTVITRPNFRHLTEVAALAAKTRVSHVRFIWPRRQGTAEQCAASLVPSYDMVQPYLERALEAARRLKVGATVDLPEDIGA